MYSVVLMAALAGGGNAPDCWFGGHGHHDGYGGHCYGGISSTCTGCYGGNYYGTWGCAGYNGGLNCYGGSWGWGGGAIDYNCFGCHGCYGCYGGFGCTGFLPYGPGPAAPEIIPPPKVEEKKGTGGSGSLAPDRAKVIVSLPGDVKLYVDNQPIKITSDKQAFSTPRLEPGQTYFYEVRAEAVRDGQTVVENKRILVRAGQEVTVSFPKFDKDLSGIAATEKRGR